MNPGLYGGPHKKGGPRRGGGGGGGGLGAQDLSIQFLGIKSVAKYKMCQEKDTRH